MENAAKLGMAEAAHALAVARATRAMFDVSSGDEFGKHEFDILAHSASANEPCNVSISAERPPDLPVGLLCLARDGSADFQ